MKTLQRSDPKYNLYAPQSYCIIFSYSVNEIPLAQLLNAIALGIESPHHGDRRSLEAMLPRLLFHPHLIAAFWTQAVNTQHDSLGVESDGLRDIPTAKSAHVFSVGHLKMSERKGLTDSFDSAANWQL